MFLFAQHVEPMLCSRESFLFLCLSGDLSKRASKILGLFGTLSFYIEEVENTLRHMDNVLACLNYLKLKAKLATNTLVELL